MPSLIGVEPIESGDIQHLQAGPLYLMKPDGGSSAYFPKGEPTYPSREIHQQGPECVDPHIAQTRFSACQVQMRQALHFDHQFDPADVADIQAIDKLSRKSR